MIGADQQPGIAFARDQLMGAMLADIVKSAQFAVTAADAEQVLAGDAEGEIVAGLLHQGSVAGELPCAGQEPASARS
jgi:hypothetical protein